jgi:hypothetical protein
VRVHLHHQVVAVAQVSFILSQVQAIVLGGIQKAQAVAQVRLVPVSFIRRVRLAQAVAQVVAPLHHLQVLRVNFILNQVVARRLAQVQILNLKVLHQVVLHQAVARQVS